MSVGKTAFAAAVLGSMTEGALFGLAQSSPAGMCGPTSWSQGIVMLTHFPVYGFLQNAVHLSHAPCMAFSVTACAGLWAVMWFGLMRGVIEVARIARSRLALKVGEGT
jgi:hypothetical protein